MVVMLIVFCDGLKCYGGEIGVIWCVFDSIGIVVLNVIGF